MSTFLRPLKKVVPSPLIRNISASIYLEVFFVLSVATIIVTRLFLQMAGYPQISGGGLHIAHVLPGGLLMLASQVILLTYLNHKARWISAVLGGIGFGLFIDEVGKFITSDNDYFYQPTIALIYVIFVLLFFAFRRLSNENGHPRDTYIINAVELSKDIFINDFDESEKTRALEYLRRGGDSDPVIRSLIKALESVPTNSHSKKTVIRRFAGNVVARYDWAVRQSWFLKVAVMYFGFIATIGILQALLNLLAQSNDFSFAAWGALLSAGVAAVLIAVGIVRIWRNRLAAYNHFRTALLILILLAQFFVFIDDELSAIAGLLTYLIGLLAVDAMIRHERSGRLPS